jgi:hypothetical protein
MAGIVKKCGILEATNAVCLLRKHQPTAPFEKPSNFHLINEGDFHSYGNDTLAAYSPEA